MSSIVFIFQNWDGDLQFPFSAAVKPNSILDSMKAALQNVSNLTCDQRLVDYFAIVEATSESLAVSANLIAQGSQNTKIRHDARVVYPTPHWSDYEFPGAQLVQTCFPSGATLSSRRREMQAFHFILADMHIPIYCTCIVFDETIDPDAVQFSSSSSTSRRRSASFTESTLLRSSFIPKALCIVSHHPMQATFLSFLMSLYERRRDSDDKRIAEIVKLFVTGLPFPPRGIAQVSFKMRPISAPIMIQRNPTSYPQYPEVSLLRMFNYLSVEVVVEAFLGLMTEQSLVVRSHSYGLMTEICENLVSFMYPFRWHHPYLPVLHQDLADYVTSPTPGIFGLHYSIELPIREMGDCMILNVAANELVAYSPSSNPMRPRQILNENRFKSLCKQVKSIIKKFKVAISTVEPSDHVLANIDEEDTHHQRFYLSSTAQKFYSEFAHLVRDVFFGFHAKVWQNYALHINPPGQDGEVMIDQDGYLYDEDDHHRDYLYTVFQTQAFVIFILTCGSNPRHPDRILFDQRIQHHKTETNILFDAPPPKMPATDFTRTDIIDVRIPPTPQKHAEINFPNFDPPTPPSSYPVYEVSGQSGITNSPKSTSKALIKPQVPKEGNRKMLDSVRSRLKRFSMSVAMTENRCSQLMCAYIRNLRYQQSLELFQKYVEEAPPSAFSHHLIYSAATTLTLNCSVRLALLMIHTYRSGLPLNSDFLIENVQPYAASSSLQADLMSFTGTIQRVPDSFFPSSLPRQPDFLFALGKSRKFVELLPETELNVVTQCEKCKTFMTLQEVASRWSQDPTVVTTKCCKCDHAFCPVIEVISPIANTMMSQKEIAESIAMANTQTTSGFRPIWSRDATGSTLSTSAGLASGSASGSGLFRDGNSISLGAGPIYIGHIPGFNGSSDGKERDQPFSGGCHGLSSLVVSYSTLNIPLISFESLVRVADLFNRIHRKQGGPRIGQFLENNSILFWNLIFYAVWTQVPLDCIMPYVLWGDLEAISAYLCCVGS